MKAIVLLPALMLTACVSSSEVTPIGNDYLITSSAKGGLNSGKGIIQATKKANDYCLNMGKTAVIRHTETHGTAEFGGENTQLIFGCEKPHE